LEDIVRVALAMGFLPFFEGAKRRFEAGLEMISRLQITHIRPEFGIREVRVGNRDVPVREEVALDLPFGKLIQTATVPSPASSSSRRCRATSRRS